MSGANTALLTDDHVSEFYLISFSLGEKARMSGRNDDNNALTLTLSRRERENPRMMLTPTKKWKTV
jgi:hypothetical protein